MDYEKITTAVSNTERDMEQLPIDIARMIRTDEELSVEQKKEAFALVRDWLNYVERNGVEVEDPFTLRSHIEAFAVEHLYEPSAESTEKISTIDINQIKTPDGKTADELIAHVTDPRILHDSRIIVYGGVVRTILKAYQLQKGQGSIESYNAELPISDVDMMIAGTENAQEIAEHYGSDLAGTKIVRDVEEQIRHYIETVDVTMNQIMAHYGRLYCTEQALEDIAEGNIRACGGEQPLFGSDSLVMPDGNAYLFRNGFYRTLAMLLRNRGERIIVSQENIDAEKDNISRYWLVLLFVKILKIPNQAEKNESILQWHQVAKDIGSTTTNSPTEFLKELAENNPEFSYFKEDNVFDIESQTRWLIGKLADQGRRKVIGQELHLPATYTPANIELRPYEGDSDLTEFWEILNSYTHNNK